MGEERAEQPTRLAGDAQRPESAQRAAWSVVGEPPPPPAGRSSTGASASSPHSSVSGSCVRWDGYVILALEIKWLDRCDAFMTAVRALRDGRVIVFVCEASRGVSPRFA